VELATQRSLQFARNYSLAQANGGGWRRACKSRTTQPRMATKHGEVGVKEYRQKEPNGNRQRLVVLDGRSSGADLVTG